MRKPWFLIFLVLPVLGQAIPLTTTAREALLEALTGPAGGYQSYAFYARVLAAHGPVEPYHHFLEGERAKVDRLKALLAAYGVSFPDKNPYLAGTAVPEDLDATARLALSLEVKSLYLEKRLARLLTDYRDLRTSFARFKIADHAQAALLRRAVATGGRLSLTDLSDRIRSLGPACVYAFGPGLCP